MRTDASSSLLTMPHVHVRKPQKATVVILRMARSLALVGEMEELQDEEATDLEGDGHELGEVGATRAGPRHDYQRHGRRARLPVWPTSLRRPWFTTQEEEEVVIVGPTILGGDLTPPLFEARRGVFLVTTKSRRGYWLGNHISPSMTILWEREAY